jgi:hypothetical protein
MLAMPFSHPTSMSPNVITPSKTASAGRYPPLSFDGPPANVRHGDTNSTDEEEVSEDDEESDEEEVESVPCFNVEPSVNDYNVILSEKGLFQFITNNFVCKECTSPVNDSDVVTVRVGCACNLYWNCSSKSCSHSASILAKQTTYDHTNTYKKKYKDVPTSIGDFDINRQVVLACQMSGGGARMASTISGCLSLSQRSVWVNHFSKVEQLLAKAEIKLGKKILEENMIAEIAASPLDPVLKRAMLTMLMDGGWDQRASGKAYDSCSGRVIGVGGITRKVCHLVYYSKRYVEKIDV